MQKHEAVDGIIVRVRDAGENSRYLSVLTAEYGRITLLAKGSHSMRSPQVAVSQLYTYANFEYYSKGDRKILKGGSVLQPFYALSREIDRLNLAAYLCDVTCELTDEGVEADDMLRLLLNSLYAVSTDLRPQELLKGAFELRAAAVSGYEPDLSGCMHCGKTSAEPFWLDVMNGALVCPECRSAHAPAVRLLPDAEDVRDADIIGRLPLSVCEAFRYCLRAPVSRLFAFDLREAYDRHTFAHLTELYLLSHIGHGFESLNFYHKLREPDVPVD